VQEANMHTPIFPGVAVLSRFSIEERKRIRRTGKRLPAYAFPFMFRARVFISYQSDDHEFAEALQDYLETAWFPTFYLQSQPYMTQPKCDLVISESRLGSEIYVAIMRRLRRADLLILVNGTNTIESPWVAAEVGVAVADRIPVLVVMLPNRNERHRHIPEGAQIVKADVPYWMDKITRCIELITFPRTIHRIMFSGFFVMWLISFVIFLNDGIVSSWFSPIGLCLHFVILLLLWWTTWKRTYVSRWASGRQMSSDDEIGLQDVGSEQGLKTKRNIVQDRRKRTAFRVLIVISALYFLGAVSGISRPGVLQVLYLCFSVPILVFILWKPQENSVRPDQRDSS